MKGAIDIGFGALLIGLGVRAVVQPLATGEKPRQHEDAPPGRLVGLMVSNVTTIALYPPAMELISESSVAAAHKAVVVAIVFVITLAFVLVPLAVVAVAPHAAGRLLASGGAWLSAHWRTLTIAICLGLGAYLVVHGLIRVL